jgi:hypothetical protein
MNNLSYYLLNEILKDNTTLIFGGGFKPPTKGHLAVVQQSLKQFPQLNKYIIFVGSGERDGITQQQSVDIWNIYKKYLPIEIHVIPVSSPIKSVYEYAKSNPDENIIWIIGGREGNEDDINDFIRRSKGIEKYPNLKAYNIITPQSDISGTKARQALKTGNKSEVISYLPPNISDKDIKQIMDIVLISTPLNESKQKLGYRAGKFEPDQPSDTLKDKGIGLANTKVGLLGTGYYFFGSKEKAEELKNKGKYNVISQIDLSSYKLFRPDDPEDFYENIKSLTFYIHSLTKDDLKDSETKENIEDAVEGFSEYLNIPYEKTNKIINEYISDIINKRLDGPLLSNRLLFNYDGIDTTGTSLDDFSVGSVIFVGKLKPGTYQEIQQLNENASYSKDIDYKSYIKELTLYMIKNGWNILPLPKIIFRHGDKENAKNLLGKTAYYDPNTQTIVLYTEGRHPKDILRSFSHEMVHHIQNIENRLGNITTTNTQEDDHLNDIEAEANLKGTMTFRNWTDSLNESKTKEYLKEYKQYVLNELFEKDLPIIDKVSKNLYIVSNGDDIEAKYDIRLEIPERDLWSVNWSFTPDNKNKSPEAWKQVTATSFKVLEDWLKTNNPKAIYISGNTGAKTKLYKMYVDKLQTLLNNRYKIDNSDEDRVVLRSIEEVHQSGIKKRMETLNESYEQALSYWQNGDINSKSKIERWNSIKKKIERQVIQEIYQTKKPNISKSSKKDPFGINQYARELAQGLEEQKQDKIF